MPDLSPHKAYTGIQICQAQQIRGLTLCRAHKIGQGRSCPVPLHSTCWDYLKATISTLALQHSYWYPSSLIDRWNRGIQGFSKLQRTQGNQDMDKIHTKSSWGNQVYSCSDTLLFPQSCCQQLSHLLISSVWSGLFKKEGGGLGGINFNPFPYIIVVRQCLFWAVVK